MDLSSHTDLVNQRTSDALVIARKKPLITHVQRQMLAVQHDEAIVERIKAILTTGILERSDLEGTPFAGQNRVPYQGLLVAMAEKMKQQTPVQQQYLQVFRDCGEGADIPTILAALEEAQLIGPEEKRASTTPQF